MAVSPLAPISPNRNLESGTVMLFVDNKWDDNYFSVSTNDYRDGVRHSISGVGQIQDKATWVAFNLPVGTVMTLANNVTSPANGQVADLSGCDRCIDLVGTGQTQGVDLTQCNMNDCVSSFFWRKVDLNLGAIELYDDVNFSGNRNVIFLSEWASGTVHSIASWWLQDRVSSVRWTTLNDRQTVTLFDNADGSGDAYSNIKGWGTTKEIARLPDVGFNDRMSSFRWDGIIPKQEVIDPIIMDINVDASNATSLTARESGTNQSTQTLPVAISLSNQDAQTLTITSTDTSVVGSTISAEYNWSAGSDLAGKTGGKISIAVSYSYTHSSTTTNTETKTITLQVTETVTVPANSSYTATLTVQIGKVPLTPYKTIAHRWYDQPLSGSVLDPANGWYKRDEAVTGTFAGGLACDTNVSVHATPLG